MNQPTRQILLGVTGGIAAYKSADLVRRLKERGADVQVVLTTAASQFVTELTFQALSGRPVRSDLWDRAAEAGMGHIELARWADDVLIAPASADMLAKLAHGLADDLLSTICLATRARLWVAPAMNQAMWSHPATVANIALLRTRGVRVIGPADGEQACGDIGAGRLVEPSLIADQLWSTSESQGPLTGVKVVVTAGPTRERIDPVRFITNRSSGKMGFAVAEALVKVGAEVVLISGPVHLVTPAGVKRIDVESAAQMFSAVQTHGLNAGIFVATAAVSDYCAKQIADHKIKKSNDVLTLELARTPDILGTLGGSVSKPFLVGFAAETENVEANALAKLHAKSLDMIAANQVGDGLAFDCDDNALTVYWQGGCKVLAKCSKQALAQQLVQLIAERYVSRK